MIMFLLFMFIGMAHAIWPFPSSSSSIVAYEHDYCNDIASRTIDCPATVYGITQAWDAVISSPAIELEDRKVAMVCRDFHNNYCGFRSPNNSTSKLRCDIPLTERAVSVLSRCRSLVSDRNFDPLTVAPSPEYRAIGRNTLSTVFNAHSRKNGVNSATKVIGRRFWRDETTREIIARHYARVYDTIRDSSVFNYFLGTRVTWWDAPMYYLSKYCSVLWKFFLRMLPRLTIVAIIEF